MIFGVELDGTLGFEKWEWGQLLDPGGFKWDPVSTPFANPNVGPLCYLHVALLDCRQPFCSLICLPPVLLW